MKKPIITALAAAALVTACQTDSPMDQAGTRFQELPSNIQQTARTEIGNAQIVDVDEERRTGETVYEITYAGMGDNEEKLHIRQDGTVLNRAESGLSGEIREASGTENWVTTQPAGSEAQFQTRTIGTQTQIDSNISSPALQADAQLEGPSVGTELEDLPLAAQSTIRAQAKGAEIDDIDKEERTGQVIYEVSFADEGKNPKIHVSQDGRLVSEEEAELFHAEAAGAQPADRIEAKEEVRGGAEALTEGPAATTEAELQADADLNADNGIEAQADVSGEAAGAEAQAGFQKAQPAQVRFNALPQPVQNAIRTRGGEAEVSEINRKVVYEVKFSDAEEKLMIHENGTIVDENP